MVFPALAFVSEGPLLLLRLLALALLALAGGATASASSTSAPCTHSGRCTDQRGGVWELGALGGGQAVAGPPDPTYRYTYAFSLYQNLDSIPQICQTFGILGTNAARYDDSSFGTCEQLGPDMRLDDGAYQFSAQDGTLTFAYAYSGSRLTVTLECEPGAGTGAPSAVTGAPPDFAVTWKTSAACSAATEVSAFPPSDWRVTSKACPRASEGHGKTNQTNCIGETMVYLTDTKGVPVAYDLSGLSKDPSGYQSSGTPSGSYIYHLNVGHALYHMPEPSCSGAKRSCDASGCSVYQTTPDGNECYAVGDADSLSASFYDPAVGKAGSPQDGLTLIMSSGGGCQADKRWTVIRLICGDDDAPGKSQEVAPTGGPGTNTCIYEIWWTHSAGCPVTPSFANAATITLGAIFLPIGLALALYGYRMWRCTIFIIGFLVFGTICGVIASLPAVNGAVWSLLGQSGSMNTQAEYIFITLSAAVGGTIGGFFFLCIYFLVIFCAGCGCGMLFFATLFMGGAGALAASHPDSMPSLSGGEVPLFLVLDLLFGICMGLVFVWWKKVCIMLGTSYYGSEVVCACIFQGFLGRMPSIVQTVAVLIGAVVAFYVQYTHTSKGYEIDHKDGGRVTVVVLPVHPQTTTRPVNAPLLGEPPAAPGLQWARFDG